LYLQYGAIFSLKYNQKDSVEISFNFSTASLRLNSGVVMEITDKFWNRLHLELDKESDRSLVIVAAALLDEALKQCVEKRMLPAKKKELCIFSGGNAPLSTFSSRINFCCQIGIISSALQRDLHIIRKLRNDFAHDPFDLSFENNSVKNRIAELDSVSDYKETNPEARSNIGSPGARNDLIFAVSWRLYSITESLNEISAVKEPIPEFGYFDHGELMKRFGALIGPKEKKQL
jgi:DNA-binding MltR family transcriptional regulator